ncbi:MAG: ABC transporter substrate-binding protein [Bacteroidetes bacterium]|nr:ABC transporter substrate-binding protein [Bacteroidota bacterium]
MNQSEIKITDPLEKTLGFRSPLKRIVSLVPSQSELLWDLGLQKELVGITKFCIHPKTMFDNIKKIGGTKNIQIDEIKKLNPCLVLANKEENEQSQIENLAQHVPIYVSDINNISEALHMIRQVGAITNKVQQAQTLVKKIEEKMQQPYWLKEKKRVAYLIWKKPYMAVGARNFISDVLHHIGFINVFAQHIHRYPKIDVSDLQQNKPDYLFLSSEPYPFQEKHAAELQAHLPHTRIVLVDGEMFSWYGSRMLHAFDYFNELIKTI